jgi:hypothetical protein
MSSPHLPGPHGFIIATKMSLLLLLFCLGAQFFPTTQERNQNSQLLNNSLPLFNNLLLNETNSLQAEPNSFQLIQKPNSLQLTPYFEPNSFQVTPYFEPNSYPIVPYFEPNSYKVIPEPNSFQLVLYREPNSFQLVLYREPNSYQLTPYFEPNSYQLTPYFEPNSYPIVPYFEPNSFQVFQNNNSVQVSYETPSLKNTSEQTVLYLLLRLQENYIDSENNTRENETIHYNIERNIILTQINSFFIFSI